MGSLLSDTAEFFKARETPIQSWYADDNGRYAFFVWVPGAEGHRTPMVVTAKQYLVNRDGEKHASFMARKVVQRAVDHDAKLLQTVGRSNRRLVFDAQLVQDYGKPSDDRSKRQRNGEDWLEVPADWGCPLQDYADRRAGPRTDPPADLVHSNGDPVEQTDDPTGTLQDYV